MNALQKHVVMLAAVGLAVTAPAVAVAVAWRNIQSAPKATTKSAPQTDPRLLAAIQATQLKYRIMPGGDCQIWITLPNGRHQAVIARSHTERFGELERRRFYSLVGVDIASLSKETLVNMLTDTDRTKIGGWAAVTTTNNRTVPAWEAKVPAELKPDDLRALVNEAAKYVDMVEAKYAHNDKF